MKSVNVKEGKPYFLHSIKCKRIYQDGRKGKLKDGFYWCFSCCECDLTHDFFVFKDKSGKLRIEVFANDKVTTRMKKKRQNR